MRLAVRQVSEGPLVRLMGSSVPQQLDERRWPEERSSTLRMGHEKLIVRVRESQDGGGAKLMAAGPVAVESPYKSIDTKPLCWRDECFQVLAA